jgi:hypothetical protein
VISSKELKMDPKKVKAIREWSSPRSIFEVRSFHGLASFYWKFIRNFSGICTSMLDTEKKRHMYFKWTEEDEKVFKILKENIIEQLILVFPYFRKTFQVRCDASGVAIGEVLIIYNRHVAYFSEKLNETNIKYSTYDKQFYAIIQALKKWRHYLVPKEFVLYSDNQALQFITRKEKLNKIHDKWIDFMQNFTFSIKHTSGNAKKFIDPLSRRCLIM